MLRCLLCRKNQFPYAVDNPLEHSAALCRKEAQQGTKGSAALSSGGMVACIKFPIVCVVPAGGALFARGVDRSAALLVLAAGAHGTLGCRVRVTPSRDASLACGLSWRILKTSTWTRCALCNTLARGQSVFVWQIFHSAEGSRWAWVYIIR